MEGLKNVNLVACANALRSNSIGWRMAKAEYEGIVEKRYTELTCKGKDYTKLGAVIRDTSDYIDDVVKGGHVGLAKDHFFIDYDLRANLLGTAQYSVECLSLSFRIDWKVKYVKVRLHTGKPRRVIPSVELQPFLKEGRVRDLTKFANATALGMREVRDEGSTKSDQLARVFKTGSMGQNKLTRLVKGCLLYLDRLEFGTITLRSVMPSSIRYNVDSLVATLQMKNTAFVYSRYERSKSYNVIVYAMCQQYPSPLLGGVEHVSVPADGEHVLLVSKLPQGVFNNVMITAELVMGSLIDYCEQFCLGDELEAAMVIACSLRQNRYLETVSLPAVMDKCDLIYPALGQLEAGVTQKTVLSLEAATMIGRFHQMATLVLFKDVSTSIKNTSISDFQLQRTMLSIFGKDKRPLMEYLEDKTSAGILQISSDMEWLSCMTEEGMTRMGQFSVFEGFWIVNNPLVALKDGIVRCLKKGVKHDLVMQQPGLFVDSYGTLCDEIALGGGQPGLRVPSGEFNIKVAGIRAPRGKKITISFEEEVECNFGIACVPVPPENALPSGLREDLCGGFEIESDDGEESDDEVEEISRPTQRITFGTIVDVPRALPPVIIAPRVEVPAQETPIITLPRVATPRETPTPATEPAVASSVEEGREEGHEVEDTSADVLGESLDNTPAEEATEKDGSDKEDEGEEDTPEEPPKEKEMPVPAVLQSSLARVSFGDLTIVPPAVNEESRRRAEDARFRAEREAISKSVQERFTNRQRAHVTYVPPRNYAVSTQSSLRRDRFASDGACTDWSQYNIEDIEHLKLSEFMSMHAKLSETITELRTYLRCLPMHKYAGKFIKEFRTNSTIKRALLGAVDVSNSGQRCAEVAFSDDWRPFIMQLRAESTKRVVETPVPIVTEEILSKFPVGSNAKEALLKEDEFFYTPDMEWSSFKGIHSYCIDWTWWRMVATRHFKLRERIDSSLTEQELAWYARYMDAGGSEEVWEGIFKSCKGHRLMRELRWHEACHKWKEINRRCNHINHSMKFKYQDKAESVRMVTAGDSYSHSKLGETMTVGEYNDKVYDIAELTEAKVKLLLHQLIETEAPIGDIAYYVIGFKMMNMQPMDYESLARILADYLED